MSGTSLRMKGEVLSNRLERFATPDMTFISPWLETPQHTAHHPGVHFVSMTMAAAPDAGVPTDVKLMFDSIFFQYLQGRQFTTKHTYVRDGAFHVAQMDTGPLHDATLDVPGKYFSTFGAYLAAQLRRMPDAPDALAD